jgi:hypothetical protein
MPPASPGRDVSPMATSRSFSPLRWDRRNTTTWVEAGSSEEAWARLGTLSHLSR